MRSKELITHTSGFLLGVSLRLKEKDVDINKVSQDLREASEWLEDFLDNHNSYESYKKENGDG